MRGPGAILLLALLVCPACASVANDPPAEAPRTRFEPAPSVAAEPAPQPGGMKPAVGGSALAEPALAVGGSALAEPALAVGGSALAEPDPFDEDEDDWLLGEQDFGVEDPIQPFNRGVFQVNEAFYRYFANPISRAVDFVLPDFAQDMLERFFSNLDEPAVFVNDVLQIAPIEAGETFARFLLNSTVGVVGLFDPATPMGLPGHYTDFGETLALYRIPSGPYLVLPILGPATARDALGETVDLALRPDIWLLGAAYVLVATGDGLTTYRVERERLDALRETSVDFYAALRSAYVMDRNAQIAERRELLETPRPPSTRCLPPPSWTRCGRTGR